MTISFVLDRLIDRLDVVCSLEEVTTSKDPEMINARYSAEMASVDPIDAFRLVSAIYSLVSCIDKKPMSIDMRAALFDLNRVLDELMEEES